MATLWSIGKKSALFGVRLFSKILIKSVAYKHDEPLALFAPDHFESFESSDHGHTFSES